jgi:CheY-like chemotaxis protein
LTKTILVVEDDVELQEYYSIMFEELDCRIVQAFDGGEALEKMKEAPPDLIILDLLLDEVMGDDVFLQVKQEPRLSGIPIVIASVLPPDNGRNLLTMDPQTTYLQKPFSRHTLLGVVRDKLKQ